MISKKFRLICASLAAVSLLAFVGCSSDNTKADENTDKPVVEESKKEDKELKVGDTFEQDGLKITVNKIREVKPTDDFMKPDEGTKWVAADVTIENIGNEDAAISSVLNFKLLDKDGRSFEMAIVTNLNGSLDGALTVGRKMTGETAFSVPMDTQEVELEVNLKLTGKPDYIKATIEQ